MVDESADCSVKKLLAVSIHYFSKKRSSIVTTFLGLFELLAGDSETLVKAV